MARKTTVVIGLLIAVGMVVAMLPAQDSTRRRASVYRVAGENLEPAPEPPGLLPLDDAISPAAALPAAAEDSNVSPAGIPGRSRTGAGSLSSQLHASSEAASQEDTPTPAAPTASPPFAMPPPSRPPATESIYAPANRPSTSPPATPVDPYDAPASDASTQSVLKRTRTAVPATPEEPARPALVPTTPRTDRSTISGGGSSRRVTPTTQSAASSRPAGSSVSIDTRSITAVAVSGRSPALRVDIAGPQGITVGKPAGYLVTIVNEGDVAAADVQLRMTLPGYVTVAGSQATSGEAAVQGEIDGQSRLVWTLPSVGARAHQSLRLDLVAGEGQSFDLGIEWVCRPTAMQAAIAVKQAQLQLSLSGPADMTFGEEKTFMLAVSNPGNGEAENVMLNLSSGENRRQQIEVGTLPAGQRKEVPVKIVASQPGEMEIHAVAAADGGLSADAAGKVIVRKAELAVIVSGPELKFAGAEATYNISIQNTGNAPADNVQIAASLPAGARYAGGIDAATPAGASLKWMLANLPAGSERSYELRLVLNSAGANRVAVQAQASAAGVAAGEIETMVEAAADLKLVVNDPSGPLATSELATYEIVVMNRGSDSARQVRIVMQFGEGIEPVSFSGGEGKVVPGQVVCQPLAELGAGEQVAMRIKARADRGGNHQFRVEVTASESEMRLVSEGTTRFFAESGKSGSAASTAKKPTLVPNGTQQR